MKRLLGWLVAAFVLILVSSYMWTHREHVADAVAVPAAPVVTQGTPTDQNYDEVREAQKAVTLAGPLAELHGAPEAVPTSRRSIRSRRRNRSTGSNGRVA